MKNFIIILTILIFMNTPNAFAKNNDGDYVILLHGLARTSKSMNKMEKFLTENGYNVININYPSKKKTIQEISGILDKNIKEQCFDKTKRINFVTHSMGGIVVRYYLKHNKLEKLNKVVMLSPPNCGSEIIDVYGYNKMFGWIFRKIEGPAAMQLSTNPKNSLPIQLGKVDFDLGIITGNKSNNILVSWMIKGENDGKVSVESSKVDGMKEHIILPFSHTFIMNKQLVLNQTLNFLQNDNFINKKDI
jgi:triacylglycerol lipase